MVSEAMHKARRKPALARAAALHVGPRSAHSALAALPRQVGPQDRLQGAALTAAPLDAVPEVVLGVAAGPRLVHALHVHPAAEGARNPERGLAAPGELPRCGGRREDAAVHVDRRDDLPELELLPLPHDYGVVGASFRDGTVHQVQYVVLEALDVRRVHLADLWAVEPSETEVCEDPRAPLRCLNCSKVDEGKANVAVVLQVPRKVEEIEAIRGTHAVDEFLQQHVLSVLGRNVPQHQGGDLTLVGILLDQTSLAGRAVWVLQTADQLLQTLLVVFGVPHWKHAW
mmetsp:Transcript_96129/g.296454  ORF Transcript_96129/g.296454 Transcript_96129/m.296454 type:complete len:285 (-) Transcript_96129:54-908(-)